MATFVRDSTGARRANLIGELAQNTALVRIVRRLPLGPPLFQFRSVDFEIERPVFGINCDDVTILDQRDWTTNGCFRSNMSDAEATRCA